VTKRLLKQRGEAASARWLGRPAERPGPWNPPPPARRQPQLHTLEALPGWARKTLEAHAADPRPQLRSLHQLEACQVGVAG
jgi:hypothetical protein